MKALASALCLMLAATGAAAQTAAEHATAAAQSLNEAVTALQDAKSSKDRVAALTRTIRAYEEGLAALRYALRQAHLRETTLEMRFESKRQYVGQLLAVLAQMERNQGPLLLMHPDGPAGTVRSGIMLAEVTPALQAEAESLKAELSEMRDLRSLEQQATATLTAAMTEAQHARMTLSQAISERATLPPKFSEDPDAMAALASSAATLEALTTDLASEELAGDEDQDFVSAKGTLALPVLGNRLRRFLEADPADVRRPGVTLATRPRALVTAPWSATIRYIGPLHDYGNVIVLEPGSGYLMILAGLDTIYGTLGDVVGPSAALGLMGGGEPGVADFMVSAQEGGGVQGTQTLYIELRHGAEPVDPAEWFAALRE